MTNNNFEISFFITTLDDESEWFDDQESPSLPISLHSINHYYYNY
jgi:hypothetical protein